MWELFPFRDTSCSAQGALTCKRITPGSNHSLHALFRRPRLLRVFPAFGSSDSTRRAVTAHKPSCNTKLSSFFVLVRYGTIRPRCAPSKPTLTEHAHHPLLFPPLKLLPRNPSSVRGRNPALGCQKYQRKVSMSSF
jgi:hypothetical protein